MDWSGVDHLWIIVMFLSAVWTLILTAPIHCRGSIAESVPLYILDGLKVSTFLANVHFWVNYSIGVMESSVEDSRTLDWLAWWFQSTQGFSPVEEAYYIYAFSRRFYPKRLAVHSGYTFFFYQYVCSLGIEPTTFCAANTMLYHWATGTPGPQIKHTRASQNWGTFNCPVSWKLVYCSFPFGVQ